jgi:competence protein ComEA
MKYLWGIAFGVVIGFLGVGLLLLTTGEPRGEPIQLSPPPTPAPLVVHVTGAVNKPGVYSLPPASRVGEAIDMAGGLADDADASLINLAQLVADGEQIWIPYQIHQDVVEEESDFVNVEPTRSRSIDLININTATQIQLESLPGIGPAYAEAIIQYRLENGPFEKIEDIQEVKGIGPITFENIRSLITIKGGSGN